MGIPKVHAGTNNFHFPLDVFIPLPVQPQRSLQSLLFRLYPKIKHHSIEKYDTLVLIAGTLTTALKIPGIASQE